MTQQEDDRVTQKELDTLRKAVSDLHLEVEALRFVCSMFVWQFYAIGVSVQPIVQAFDRLGIEPQIPDAPREVLEKADEVLGLKKWKKEESTEPSKKE